MIKRLLFKFSYCRTVVVAKVNRIRLGTPEKVNKGKFTEGVWMTSRLCQYFQASQAVHGGDNIMTQHFLNQVNSLRACGLINYCPYSNNFGLWHCGEIKSGSVGSNSAGC